MNTNYSAWQIKASNYPSSGTIREQIEFVARYGLLAPSAHNVQPWEFSVGDSVISIRTRAQNALKDGDPTGRETWIGLGACAENIMLAGGAFGMKPQLEQDAPDNISISFSPGSDVRDPAILEAITARHSNRRRFEKKSVSADMLSRIEKSYPLDDVKIFATNDVKIIELAANLTGKAIAMAMSIPEFKQELVRMLRTDYTSKYDGLTGSNMALSPIKSILEYMRFHYGDVAASESKRERAMMKASGGLVLIFAKGDVRKYWIESGRAYQRAGLEATSLGLSISTMAAIVEAPDFHQEIEETVGTDMRLQTVMRIGYSASRPSLAPRFPLEKILTSTS